MYIVIYLWKSFLKWNKKLVRHISENELVTSHKDFKRLHNQEFFRQLKRKIMNMQQY